MFHLINQAVRSKTYNNLSPPPQKKNIRKRKKGSKNAKNSLIANILINVLFFFQLPSEVLRKSSWEEWLQEARPVNVLWLFIMRTYIQVIILVKRIQMLTKNFFSKKLENINNWWETKTMAFLIIQWNCALENLFFDTILSHPWFRHPNTLHARK